MSQNVLRLLGKSVHGARSSASVLTRTAMSALVSTSPTFESSLLPLVGSGLGSRTLPQYRFFTASRRVLSSSYADPSDENEDDEMETVEEKERDEAFLSIDNPQWEKAGLDPRILKRLGRNGITQFTPVQGEAFAHVINGQDVIGRSRTGTGKTLAFGLPSMTRLVDLTIEKGTRDPNNGRMQRGRSVSMVVLCPTRELARQVSDELSIYAGILGLSVACFHGGVSYNPQVAALQNGMDILVGTPGRVFDHINSGNLDLKQVNIAVLDEADEMLNMGFAQQVEKVLEGMGSSNAERTQCLMFSATTPDWIVQIGQQYQENPVSIDSTGDEGGARVANTVRHSAVELPYGVNKNSVVESIIVKQLQEVNGELEKEGQTTSSRQGSGTLGKVIIFTNTKREADELANGTAFRVLRAKSLHGDHSQHARDLTLDQFRDGRFNVLVATDVAARGIDIKEVDLVVQMSPPNNADAYVHRSGRTGRAGRKGAAVVIANRSERRDLIWIERDLGHDFKFDFVDPPSMEDTVALAIRTSSLSVKSVRAEHVEIFQNAADHLLSEFENPKEVVARCLATMNQNVVSPPQEFHREDMDMVDPRRRDDRGYGGRPGGRGGGRGGYGGRGGGGRGGYSRGGYSRGGYDGGNRSNRPTPRFDSRQNERGGWSRFSPHNRKPSVFDDEDDYGY